MKHLFALVFLTAAIAFGAEPVVWKVENVPAAVTPGNKFAVKLVAKIEPGWHMYSMKPILGGPVATRIWVGERQSIRLTGPVRATEPRNVQDSAFVVEVEIYDDTAAFIVPLQAAADPPTESGKPSISVSYQTCDGTICLAPKTVNVEVPVKIGRSRQ